MKTEKQQIRDCSYEIIMGMEDDVPKEELFTSLTTKYSDEVLMKALEMVDKFQHWRAKKHGINLDEFDKQFRNDEIKHQNMRCFEPELEYFSGTMVREKEDKSYGK